MTDMARSHINRAKDFVNQGAAEAAQAHALISIAESLAVLAASVRPPLIWYDADGNAIGPES